MHALDEGGIRERTANMNFQHTLLQSLLHMAAAEAEVCLLVTSFGHDYVVVSTPCDHAHKMAL